MDYTLPWHTLVVPSQENALAPKLRNQTTSLGSNLNPNHSNVHEGGVLELDLNEKMPLIGPLSLSGMWQGL